MGSMGFLGLNGFQVPIRTGLTRSKWTYPKQQSKKKQKDQLA
jgi:hypothetical protein